MGQIGNWGIAISFTVNSSRVLTFKDMKRTVTGRWQSHAIIGKKPKTEFLGPDASGVELTVTLSAENGVSPRTVIKTMEHMADYGRLAYLYIGGRKVGTGRMYLASISETWDEVWNQGELARASMNLTFGEYR